jgi:hypothetical protein
MLVLFLSMQDIARGEKRVKVLEFIGISAACYFVSLGLFWILLMRENGVTVPAGLGLVSNLISRYMAYYKMIYSDHTKIWLVLMIIVAAVYVYVICQTTVMRKACILLLGIFSVCVGSGLCFGAYLFISEEAFDTRAMYGFHVFLALMAVYASFHGRFWLSKLPYAALAWSFLIFSLTYGNALVQQKDYMNYRVTLLAGDLNALEIMKTDEIKKIRIIIGDRIVDPRGIHLRQRPNHVVPADVLDQSLIDLADGPVIRGLIFAACHIVKLSLSDAAGGNEFIRRFCDRLTVKDIRIPVNAPQSFFPQGRNHLRPFSLLPSPDQFNQAARKKQIVVILHRSPRILSETARPPGPSPYGN